jgi:hypothetical protein
VEKIENYSLKQASKILGLKKSQITNLRQEKRALSALEELKLIKNSNTLAARFLSFYRWQEDDLVFWKNLESLQSKLGSNDQMMANYFKLTQRQFRFYRSRGKSFSRKNLEHFQEISKTHPIVWFCSDIDILCIANNISAHFKRSAYLPSQFEGGGSKMRSLSNALLYVKKEWGEECMQALMNSMQIHPDAINFSEKSISIQVFSTLHKKLRHFGANDEDFVKMGAFNRLNAKNKRMLSQKIPRSLKSPLQVMDYFFSHLAQSIDQNRHYKVVSKSLSKIELQLTPTPLFQQAYFPLKPFSQYEIALYISGHLKVVPTYFGLNEFSQVALDFDEQDASSRLIAYF